MLSLKKPWRFDEPLLRQIFELHFVPKGERAFVHSLEEPRIIYLFKGLLIESTQEERVLDIHGENDFAGTTGSFLVDDFTTIQFIALEDCVIYSTPYKKFLAYEKDNPSLLRLRIRLLEEALVKKSMKLKILAERDLKSQYGLFEITYPGLVNKVPQYLIASFLQVSPVSLSRALRQK